MGFRGLSDDQETSSECKFKGHVYFSAGCWSAVKTYEDAVLAAVEKQYLPTDRLLFLFLSITSSIRMESFYNSAAEHDRELLKLQILCYVQAKSLADNSRKNGPVTDSGVCWSGKRSRAAFRCMKRIYLTLKST